MSKLTVSAKDKKDAERWREARKGIGNNGIWLAGMPETGVLPIIYEGEDADRRADKAIEVATKKKKNKCQN